MKVVATQDCFFDNVRRRPGDTFTTTRDAKALPAWVKVVEPDSSGKTKPRTKKDEPSPDDF